MTAISPLAPLADLPVAPTVAALPKADLHLHQEWSPRLDRVLARRAGRAPYDWHAWATQLMAETPPGMPRLGRLSQIFPGGEDADAEDANFIARIEDMLEEAAADGAVMVEVRIGNYTVLRPGVMALIREAERRVRERYPRLHATVIETLLLHLEPERLEQQLQACITLAGEGLGGIDLLYRPYDAEADWAPIYRLAERAAAAGLGITAHAGEFSPANIAAAAAVPGLTRLGHAVYAAGDPRLLDLLAARGITVECSLTCNVVLGAVPSFEEHPIRRFVASGIPVALCTDNPVQMCTSIGREYAIAAALGFTPADLLGFTASAICASFSPSDVKERLLADLRQFGQQFAPATLERGHADMLRHGIKDASGSGQDA